MTKKRRKRCPNCGFIDTINKGVRNGSVRYYCKHCNSYFTDKREYISHRNMFVWFKHWVRDKQSILQISRASGYSERTLKRYFYQVLPMCPQWHIQRREKVNLLIDGTYFANKVCLLLYRDSNIKMTVLYRLTKSESLRELKEDLRNIKSIGIDIESVTCDGAANIIKAVREVCPKTIIQRCTFHIAHEIGLWLTKKPKSDAGKELLYLSKLLSGVQNSEDAQLWIRAFIDWHYKYEDFINEIREDEATGRWWYKHKLLHRSTTHIKRALPYMFSYTRYTNVPKTSNSIESFFGHLKDHLRLHRGLSDEHFKDFVKWYLFLHSNQDKLTKNNGENN